LINLHITNGKYAYIYTKSKDFTPTPTLYLEKVESEALFTINKTVKNQVTQEDRKLKTP